MLKALLAAGLAVGVAYPVTAQPGAPGAAPMAPGAWGPGGWQAGGVAGPVAAPGPMADGPDRDDDYRRPERGGRMFGPMLDPRYTVSDWHDWGLAPPPPGTRWVRYYDDAVLVDAGGGVVDARYDLAWDAPGAPGGATGAPVFGTTTVRTGPNTVVTTTTTPAPAPVVYGAGDAGGYGYPAAAVTVTPGVVTTTTTTTEVTTWGPSRRRHARRGCACRR